MENSVVPSHPPITEVAVFSDTPIHTVDIGFLLPGSMEGEWSIFLLSYIGQFKAWHEYRVDNWMRRVPNCLKPYACCQSRRLPFEKYPSTTFFDCSDAYGYYRESADPSFTGIPRVGYSVKEGTSFFVNFLAPPSVWKSSEHHLWPPSFRKEVFQILLLCKRFGGVWRNLSIVLIQQLAQLTNTSNR